MIKLTPQFNDLGKGNYFSNGDIFSWMHDCAKASKHFEQILFEAIKSLGRGGVKVINCKGADDYMWSAVYSSRKKTWDRTGRLESLRDILESTFCEYMLIPQLPLDSLTFELERFPLGERQGNFLASYNRKFFKKYYPQEFN